MRLVYIRALSRDIRRRLYWELLRCSGIHLDESALMTELYGAHPDNYHSALIKQTTSRALCHALTLLSLLSPLCSFSPLSFPSLALLPFLSPPLHFTLFLSFAPFFLIAICHSSFGFRQFPVSWAAGGRDGDDERRNHP